MDINDFGHNSFVHTKGLVERIEMTKHLFKLKKDGKTVGYERFVYCDQREGYLKGKSLGPQHSKDGIHWDYIYLWDLKTTTKGYWFEGQLDMDVYIEHDEKYPFVTKDKNDKDVFVGDKVESWYPCGRLIADDLIVEESNLRASNGYNEANISNIELIEDKDNE